MHFAVDMSSVHRVSTKVYELFSGCKIAWGRETYFPAHFTIWQVKMRVKSTFCLIDVQEQLVRSLICGEQRKITFKYISPKALHP
jgi:hypothetical protein